MCLLATDLDLLHQCSSLLSKNYSVFRQNHSVLKQKYIFNIKKIIQPWNTKWCLATYFQTCYVVFVWFFIWTFCELLTDGFVHAFVFTRLSSSTWASPDWPSLMRWICVSTLTPFTTSCSGEERLLIHCWLFFFTPLLLKLSDFSPDTISEW